MTELPSPYNVDGSIFSTTGLEKIAEILRNYLGLSKTEVSVYKSQFNGSQTLYIRTAEYEFEFETRTGREENTWHISGSVAGDRSEILDILKYLFEPLRRNGFESKFEIYDRAFNCIAEYPQVSIAVADCKPFEC
jgi:hypothetical protein